jgi:hypothetical protein
VPGTDRPKCEGIVEADLERIGHIVENWIGLVKDSVQSQAVVNTAMKLRVP